MAERTGKAAARQADRNQAPARAANRAGAVAADGRSAQAAASPAWQNLKDLVDFVTKAVAALVALTSVVYLLGGLILAGRLTMYRLPWEILINQLPQGFLVTIALTEVVMPVVAAAFLYLLILYSIWQLEHVRNVVRKSVPFTGNEVLSDLLIWSLVALLVFLIARLGFGMANGWSLLEAAVAAGLAIAGALATYLVFDQAGKNGLRWPRHKSTSLIRTALLAAALVPLIVWNAITLPMPYAHVCPTKSVPDVSGWLIGQTSDRVILGNPDYRRNVFLTPSSNATIMATYNDPKKYLPPCPSVPPG
jgi:hypothetical protein